MNAGDHLIPGNEHLPFDALVQLFEYYSLNESTSWPIETLLLVCKAWNEAALQSPSLWTRYRINLREINAGSLWLHRLPLRLQRSGSTRPLHIDIRYPRRPRGVVVRESFNAMKMRSEAVRSAIPCLLNLLAGENGRLCERWKTFQLEVDPQIRFTDEDFQNYTALSYPMPLLTSVYLSVHMYTNSGIVIFPKLPSLTSVTIEDTVIGNYPDTSHATRIELKNTYCPDPNRWMELTEVQSLFISQNVSFPLYPQELPALRTLYLHDNAQAASSLKYAVMPRLEDLIVDFEDASWLSSVSQMRAIASVRILHLLGRDGGEQDQRLETGRLVLSLLYACVSLQTLLINEIVLPFLDDRKTWKQLFKEGSTQIFLRTQDGDKQLVYGEDNSAVMFGKVVVQSAVPTRDIYAL